MATRGEELNTRITATDEASAVVDRVADKVGEIEDQPHDVKIGADTEQAEQEARQLDQRLKGLTDDEKRVVLRLMAQDAQRDIDRFNKDLARAEKFSDQEIAMRIEARDNASKKLDAIQAEMREIDGEEVRARVNIDADAALAKLDDLGVQLGVLGPMLAKLGGGAGIAAGIGALVAGAGLVASSYANAAIAAQDLSTLTGDSVEFASRIGGVWAQSGADAKDLQDVLLQMNGVLQTNKELVEQIGVKLDPGQTIGQRFLAVVDALDRIPDAARRSQLASQLFGEEGVRQYNALKNSVDDVSAAVENYRGKVFTEADAKRARDYSAAVANIRTEFEQLTQEIGSAVLPGLADVLSGLVDIDRQTQDMTGKGLFEGIGGAINQILTGESTLTREVKRNAEEQEAARRRVIEAAVRGAAETTSAVETTTAAYAEQTTAVERVESAIESLQSEIEEQRGVWDELGRTVDSATTGVGRFERALRDAFSAKSQELIDAVMGKIAEADQAVRDRLDFEGLVDDIKAQFGEVNEAAKEAGKGGEDAAHRHREAVRQLRFMMLDLIGDLDHLSANDKIRLVAEVERTSIDGLFRLLGTLTQGITVPVSFSQTPRPGFESANISVGGGKAPSLDFAGVQSAIPSGNVYVFPPIGSTPTSVTEQGRDYLRQFGDRTTWS